MRMHRNIVISPEDDELRYHAGRIERPPNAALRYDSNDLFVAVQDFLPLSLSATRMVRERAAASKQAGRFIPSCRLALNAARPKR